MAVVLALAAALLFALGTVLQQRAAVAQRAHHSGPAGLLLALARRPVWIAGIVVDSLGFAAQAAALGIGRLVVVQPVIATSIVFALPLGARFSGQRTTRRDVLAAAAVTVALAAFLVLGNPTAGHDDAPLRAWIAAGAPIAVLSAALVAGAAGRRPSARAAMLGTATGVLFGLSAALTKATVVRIDDGVLSVVGDWHLYALIAVGYVSMTLSQMSLETGALAPAMATSMALDPVTSLVLGVWLLDEGLHRTRSGTVGSAAALVVMLAGLIVLAASRGRAQLEAGRAEASRPSSAKRAAL